MQNIDITRAKPIIDRVFVECVDSDIDLQSKIIYIPEEFRKNCQVVKVIAISNIAGRQLQGIVNEGDYCIVQRRDTGFELIDVSGKRYLNIDWRVILAKIEEL